MPTTTAIDETMIERAILDLLKTRREIYPSHIVGELRRSHAGLPLDRTRDVLERCRGRFELLPICAREHSRSFEREARNDRRGPMVRGVTTCRL